MKRENYLTRQLWNRASLTKGLLDGICKEEMDDVRDSGVYIFEKERDYGLLCA